MTTDTKALIEEARALSNKRKGALDPYQVQAELEDMVDRLVAALEEATVPEGWEVERWSRTADGVAIGPIGPCWTVKAWRKARQPRDFPLLFPTAREAMAALDTQKAPPP